MKNNATRTIRSEEITIDVRICAALAANRGGEVYLAAIAPDMELTVITLDEAPGILPCFDEDDAGYGISKEELKAAIPCGIGKINVDTDIRLAVTRNFRELFRDHPELKEDARVGGVWKLLDEKRDAFDPRAFLAPIMDTVMYGTGDEGAVALITDAMRRGVKEAVGTLIVEFGSYGKAPLVEPATLEDMAARYAKEG